MKLAELILKEGVRVHSYELLAYVMVVAEEFHKLPKIDPEEVWRWEALIAHDARMLPRVTGKIDVQFVDHDPYKNQRELMFDIIVNKRMQVYQTQDDGGQEGSHPGMSNRENDVFRAVHDYIGHFGPNAQKVGDYIAQHNIKDKNDPEFKKLRFERNSFTVRGEMNTFVTHARLAPPESVPALFTEIVGQICTYFVTNNYTVNKVAVISGIDYKNLGNFLSSDLTARKRKYMQMLADGDVESIEIDVPGVVIDKDKIRWNLLSRGEGQVRKGD
jgi:hypothetical protein